MYNRILSLAPSNTEILFALGLGDRIAGVTTFCDYPGAAGKIPKAGSWIHVRDMEKIRKLNPDLILTSMYVPPAVKEWAEKNNVRLVNLFPQTLKGVYDSFMMIGVLTGTGTKAKEIVSDVKLEIGRIQELAQRKRPKIYTEEFHRPPTVAGNWVPELIKAAGGIPMIKEGKLSPEVTLKQVEKFDPDIILLHWCGFHDKSKKEDLLKRGWRNLRAVKEKKVFAVDDTFLNRPGPRIWKGARLIQDIIRKA
ncbi:TPA: cobalamin-binding protein [Candidatus Woesearchaeota archaeon]|nr:Iron/cobalamin ABC transporter periplasmic substrate-binding protein [archaeon GW2011_AR15]MBS3103777.1 cobalamin-binding protein [Candidatus Woesearchaeota archaeon]HIH41478.1 cobalamin-binding protein [Candidatus Woesearchaeota archaeon]